MDALNTYIKARTFERPTLVIDVDQVEKNYHALKQGMSSAFIHYAVKSNPHSEILKRLVALGCRFDAASRGEIESCLAAGADPKHISFGNTVKKPRDIEYARSVGVDLFSVDAEEEMEKIARHAPGSKVFVRVLIRSTEAEWSLSRKFGCSSSMVVPLMDLAVKLGLNPIGLSFHVGSQTRHPHMWYDSLDAVAAIWHNACKHGHELSLLNIGGGFPAYYGIDVTDSTTYGANILAYVQQKFGCVEYIMAEPGRGLVGNAGAIAAEVLLVSRKTQGDPVRWVYLNIGRFGGLAETEQEAIKYQFLVPGREHSETAPCIMAGPTCDSADVLYEKHHVQLPVDLASGDQIIIQTCGAYTSTYSSVAFNGFEPLSVEIFPSDINT